MDGKLRTHPNKEVTGIGENYRENISKEEAQFLVKFPLDERINMHKDKLWETIDKLSVGDRCRLRSQKSNLPYKIVDKNRTADGVIYKVKSYDEPSKEVDVSDILPWVEAGTQKAFSPTENTRGTSRGITAANFESTRKGGKGDSSTDPLTAAKAPSQVSTSNATIQLKDKDEKPTPPTRHGSSGGTKKEPVEDNFLSPCNKFGLEFVNPKIFDKINMKINEGTKISTRKKLVLEKTKAILTLKWKGVINYRVCIGGEMDIETEYGFNCKCNDEQLFTCDRKKGVLIALKDNGVKVDQICERGGDEKYHKPLLKTTDNTISEDCICCIEDQTADNGYKDRKMTLTDTMSGVCKWYGFVNGLGCVGVELEGRIESPYKYGGVVNTMKLFSNYKKIVLFPTSDITSIVRCYQNDLKIINSTKVKHLSKGNPCDKILSLKQGVNSSMVIMKWKGEVDGKNCIGCELSKTCEYGTNGTFNGQNVFKCDTKKGVLILLDENTVCCENDQREHNKITNGVRKFIDLACICCIETKDEAQTNDVKLWAKITLSDKISGIIKWKGLINGEECIGLDVDKCLDGFNGKINGIELFKCSPYSGVLIRTTDLTSKIRCERNKVNILDPKKVKVIKESNACDTLLILKQGEDSSMVRMKWNGEIDGKKCIGCELSKDCEYGTNGTFNNKELFMCTEKRGVLISLDGNTECCKSCNGLAKDHNTLKPSADNFIELASICCVDSKVESVIADEIIISDNHSCTVQWKGIINGKECIGVEIDGYRKGFDGKINDFKLFDCGNKSGVLAKKTDIPDQLMCHEIGMKILNHTMIQVISSGRNIDMYIVPKIAKEVKTLRAIWFGKVDGKDVVGCILPNKHKYGTKGTFNGHKLFECDENNGVLIPKEEFVYKCAFDKPTHNTLRFHDNKYIDENSICCVDRTDNSVTPDTDFTQILTLKGKKYLSKCLWTGRINGVDAIGVEMNVELDQGTNGEFRGIKLFSCAAGMGFLLSKKEAKRESKLTFISDVYLENNIDITNVERISVGDKINRIVCINEGYKTTIYGRIVFTISLLKECLIGVKINKDSLKDINNRYKDIIWTEDALIIAMSSKVTEFLKEVRYNPRSNVIDETCIKSREPYESKNIICGDIVEVYGNYWRIQESTLLNGIPCVGVIPTISFISDKTLKYVEEDKVKKVTVDNSTANFMEMIIFSPDKIVICEAASHSDFKEKDEVEFNLRGLRIAIQGIIRKIVKVNNMDTPFAMIELNSNVDEISKYRINGLAAFRDIITLASRDVLVVLLNALHEIPTEIITCPNNNVPILNPARIKPPTNISRVDKILIFPYNRDNITVTMKWIGRINDVEYIGCEMPNKSPYGTNGMFGNYELFDCAGERGLLIPLDKIDKCCVKTRNHLPVLESNDGTMEVRGICCAERLDQCKEKPEIKEDVRVIRENKNGLILGICRWIGLVNNKEVIGVEMTNKEHYGNYGWLDKIAVFDCPPKKRAFFRFREFQLDIVGLRLCSIYDILIVDPINVKSAENGSVLEKKMIYKLNSKITILDIKWRGMVNGELCVGCALNDICEFGTDGRFGEHTLFHCGDGKGVLIPVNKLRGSCEDVKHREIKVDDSGIVISSVCCVETLNKLRHSWPGLNVGGKIIIKKSFVHKFTKWFDTTGECIWIGEINGKEAVGVQSDNGTNELFSFDGEFKCKGLLFLADDIEHDFKNENIVFMFDYVVDVNKIWKIREISEHDTKGFVIGDYIYTSITDGRSKLKFNGEIKWMGRINDANCVGIDLEDEYEYGMGEVIEWKRGELFRCPPRHGIITIIDKVECIKKDKKDKKYPQLNDNGMINAKKYVEYEEEYNIVMITKRNLSMGKAVFVILDNYDGARWKRKGLLRWSGTMNHLPVGVVELDQDCVDGCDGVFWRHRIIECRDHRAIAVPWDNIHQYIPYETMDIPITDRKFKEININSAVKCYHSADGRVVDLCGTVRWSGKGEHGEYLYGIELDDKYNGGTDGQFGIQRLFKCQDGLGFIASIDVVAPDTRFNESIVKDVDVPKSETSDAYRLATPALQYLHENKGIQGNANSCYFDSSIFALFSKSDVLDFLIHPLFDEKEKNPITKEFRDIISHNIVYPLRRYGYVSFHHTKEMRSIIEKYGGKFLEMTKQESDMENVSALLTKLCPDEQLLSLRSFAGHTNNVMFLQLFMTLDNPVRNITSQQMLDMSMVQNNIMFNKPPTCLIIQAPRDARGINCYQNVLPSKTIEISNLCYPSYKRCYKCGDEATQICNKCMIESLNVKDGLLCVSHKCWHDGISKIPNMDSKSRSKVQMKLKAIICIEKAHFVAYVKEDEFKKEWVFFDSMSTQDIKYNYAVPKVSTDKFVTTFLNSSTKDMEHTMEGYANDDRLKRILKDSYIFVYHNSAQTCY